MKTYVITLKGNEYSERVSKRCIESGKEHGINIETFTAIDKNIANQIMLEHGLKWTWADNNTRITYCPITKLRQHPYGNLITKIGCSMSHFLLWKHCVKLNEPILILEHDAVFIHELPEFKFNGICQINDPKGATPRGKWWSEQMVKRGSVGVHEKTWIRQPNERYIPDGLAGNSAYLIKPWAAQEVINTFYRLGVWMNDATICKQLFSYLEEYYPFITKVEQEISTTSK